MATSGVGGSTRTPSTSRSVQSSGRTQAAGANISRGDRGRGVASVQRALNAGGAGLAVDGKFGPLTDRAVRDFQRQNGLKVDGIVGPQTIGALERGVRGQAAAVRNGSQPGVRPASGVEPRAAAGAPPNKVAQFESVSKAGQRSQMMSGRITINGNTYDFRSGGGGRGNLPPGDYKITPHLWSRSDRSMSVGGVGYSFAMSDKYDKRVGGTRSLLRIHPDGGGPGTIGCIGIVGDAATQRQFREDMRAELARNGGAFNLSVRP
jgi:peptidoglycan hydrolase-like protein with peptidoglycan-binding domain